MEQLSVTTTTGNTMTIPSLLTADAHKALTEARIHIRIHMRRSNIRTTDSRKMQLDNSDIESAEVKEDFSHMPCTANGLHNA